MQYVAGQKQAAAGARAGADRAMPQEWEGRRRDGETRSVTVRNVV